MGQFATGLATKSRLKSQLRFRERGQTFGKLKRKDTGKYDEKKIRMESFSTYGFRRALRTVNIKCPFLGLTAQRKTYNSFKTAFLNDP